MKQFNHNVSTKSFPDPFVLRRLWQSLNAFYHVFTRNARFAIQSLQQTWVSKYYCSKERTDNHHFEQPFLSILHSKSSSISFRCVQAKVCILHLVMHHVTQMMQAISLKYPEKMQLKNGINSDDDC